MFKHYVLDRQVCVAALLLNTVYVDCVLNVFAVASHLPACFVRCVHSSTVMFCIFSNYSTTFCATVSYVTCIVAF